MKKVLQFREQNRSNSAIQKIQQQQNINRIKTLEKINSLYRLEKQEKNKIKSQRVVSNTLARIVYEIRLMRATKLYNYCYLTLTIFLAICLILESTDPTNVISNISKKCQYVCHCGFIIFVVIRLMSFQPIHFGWCLFECLSFVSGLSTIFVKNQEIKPYLHALSCLRLIIIVRTTSLYVPFSHFLGTFRNVARVALPVLILTYLFSLTALFVFFVNQYEQNGDQSINSIMVYKNIFYSFYHTYKMLFIGGWSRVAYFQQQTTNQIFVILFDICFLYLISYIYMNILYGTMMANQQQQMPVIKKIELNILQKNLIILENDNDIKNKRYRKNRNGFIKSQVYIKKFISLFINNFQLCQKYLLVVVKKFNQNNEIGEQQNSYQNHVFKNQKTPTTVFLQKDYYLPQNIFLKQLVVKIGIIYNMFDFFMIVMGCLNLCISTQSFKLQASQTRNTIDIICIFWLFLNLFLKLVWHYFKLMLLKKWCNENKAGTPAYLTNFDIYLKFELIIAIISGAGLLQQIIKGTPFQHYPQYKIHKILRAIKYTRICKIFIYNCQLQMTKKLKIMLLSIVKVIQKILHYLVYFFLMVTLFSVIGFNLFKLGDQNNFNYKFSTVFQSFIFVFMMFFNQARDAVLFEQYPLHGVIFLLFQLIVLTIGNAILSKYFMTLFLTQLLEQLDHKHAQLQKNQQAISNSNSSNKDQLSDSERISSQCYNNTDDHCQNNANQKIKTTEQQYSCNQEIPIVNVSFISKVKRNGQIFLSSKYFFGLHLLVTVICIIEVAYRSPLIDRTSQAFIFFEKLETITSLYFIIELVISLFCFGIFDGQNSFIRRQKTAILTLIITIICSLSFSSSLGRQQIIYKLCKLKVLRMFVTLELACNICYRLKLTIIGFILLLPKTLMFLGVVVVYYGFFAIILVAVYANQDFQCVNYPNNVYINDIRDCLYWGGDWVEDPLSNNQSLTTLLNLVVVSLTQSWNDFITALSQIRGANLQPEVGANYEIYVLIIYGYMTGSFLILNLFTGFLLYQMNRIMSEVSGKCELDKFEENWLCIKQQINLMVLNAKIQFQKNTIRDICNIISTSKGYQVVKIVYICSLLVFLSLISRTILQIGKEFFVIYLGYFCSSFVFTFVELAGKNQKIAVRDVVANGLFYGYAVWFFVHIFTGDLNEIQKNDMILGGILTAMQLFQHWIYFTRFEIVKKTLKYLYIILPRAIFILIPMLIVLLTYTFIALQLFAYLNISFDNQHSIIFTYTTFFKALQSLVRFSTQSQISQIISASKSMGPDFICFQVNSYSQYLQYGLNGCGSKTLTYLFFLTFHVLYSLTISSALMANIFDSYIQVKKQEHILVNEFELEKVTEEWLKYDEKGSGFLPCYSFWLFTTKLYSIYGIKQKESLTIEVKYQFLKTLNVNLYRYQNTIQQLTRLLLCKKHKKQCKKNKADLIFQKIYGKKIQCLQKTEFTSKDLIGINVLKKGLKKWNDKIKAKKQKNQTNMNFLIKSTFTKSNLLCTEN